DVHINIDKCDVIRVGNGPNSNLGPLRFGLDLIHIADDSTLVRYLGIWISGDNKTCHTERIIRTSNEFVYNKIMAKRITDKASRYIIIAVSQAMTEYRTISILPGATTSEAIN